jgi:hypothetical protein
MGTQYLDLGPREGIAIHMIYVIYTITDPENAIGAIGKVRFRFIAEIGLCMLILGISMGIHATSPPQGGPCDDLGSPYLRYGDQVPRYGSPVPGYGDLVSRYGT